MLSVNQLSGSALFSRAFDSTIVREDLLSQNTPRQLSALQQVVAFMTIGRDMSGHFSDIAPLCSSTNLAIKRLVYLYLMHNSHAQPQKAVLQAGVFVKDTVNDSPLIRGAALRTMTSLLVPVMVDFITAPLQRCLEDSDPYVRRIAAFGTLKLFYIAPNVCEELGLLEKLKNQLHDENACVVASAVAAILELRQRHAPISLEEAIVENVSRVLEAASDAPGWYQHYLIEGVAVAFKNNSLMLDMERAEKIIDGVMPFLSSFNVATVMSAVKAMTSFLLQASALFTLSAHGNDGSNKVEKASQLRDRYGPKLVGACVSLLYECSLEVRYAAFRNIRLLLKTGLVFFFKRHLGPFFVKYDDPIYIKLEKSELLLELADIEVGEIILSEFAAYATDADEELVRKAVRLIGFLAAKLEPLAEQCVERLLGLIDTGMSHVMQEAAVVVQTILRRYPNRFLRVVRKLCEILDELRSPESKAAVVWVLGDHAEHVENAGDILEMCAESFSTQPEIVQFALLTAAMKIYLSSECKDMGRSTNFLQRVLSMATQSPRPDVRDRAFMYWRLVTSDTEAAKKLVFTFSKGLSFTMADTLEKRRLQSFLTDVGSLTAVLHRPLHLIYSNETGLNENDEEEEDAGDHFGEKFIRRVVCDDEMAGTMANNLVSKGPNIRDKESMHVALPADEGNGLEVRMCWSQLGNKLLLNCHFSLVSGEGYTRHAVVRALQINRNIHALGLAQECPVVELEVGEKEPETLQLMTGTNNEKSPMRDLLVAVNVDPIGTRYFLAPTVPPAMLLLPAASIDYGFFAHQFQQLHAPSWTMPTTLTPTRTDQTRYTANALRLHGLNLVYTSKLHGSGILRLFISAETIAAQKLFMEAAIQDDLVVYLGVRCKDPQVPPVFGAYTLSVLSVAEN
ncbi:putative adaptin-related protein-like [Trypanosoma cruzi]|uniref:AP complex subunit beta n=2 Tax=Trypanosoma cruzi TaxID=5693 RepID=Q4E0Q1_TRYCC|nr:beta-adaptin 1, putative [Trypanosoma cruzi]EAN98351.1 beta-adaptin 1, putative [Trypanosoma cruzi]PWV13325.1 putative adaptin-related protein-like [Trypanosoma cruzi]|eukprot:XP_820202.1 beta-adaptin 1 [Trypanosoma cruzi strain CL Brener]